MFESPRRGALAKSAICCRSGCDACRLERTSFPGCPVQRVSSVIARGEIDERHRFPSSDPFCDDIPHKELPVILVGNKNYIDNGGWV